MPPRNLPMNPPRTRPTAPAINASPLWPIAFATRYSATPPVTAPVTMPGIPSRTRVCQT